ncbi:MORC family CW-type zinc finger protein 3 [Lamellibrachia satsuma]|nr:MORC family CW-type zinc finger protein 3 [Lamellibrachia satsuma]
MHQAEYSEPCSSGSLAYALPNIVAAPSVPSTIMFRMGMTNPSFLHANSTSHTWVFSAFAELIDNANDAKATELRIEYKTINETPLLEFHDDGKGMNTDELYNMLSLGYSHPALQGDQSIGVYGNGFKSGSMRLGRDAMVFTKSNGTMSIGFLSQTYLKKIQADRVLVPIITWDMNTKRIIEPADSTSCLQALTTYSTLFNTEQDLLAQFDAFKKGTVILIYNLQKQVTRRQLELDFESVSTDILISAHQEQDSTTEEPPASENKPEYRCSLREYCSILYLRPRMKIILRGEDVKTKVISEGLSRKKVDQYKPKWLASNKSIRIKFGLGKSQEDYGIVMYHHKRLIKAYEKVGCQASSEAIGVVGVVQCDFLEPNHIKQDFNKTNNRYNLFIRAVGSKLDNYWNTEKPPRAVGNTLETYWNTEKPTSSERAVGNTLDNWNKEKPPSSKSSSDSEEDEDESMPQTTGKTTPKKGTYKKTPKKKTSRKRTNDDMSDSTSNDDMSDSTIKQRRTVAVTRSTIVIASATASDDQSGSSTAIDTEGVNINTRATAPVVLDSSRGEAQQNIEVDRTSADEEQINELKQQISKLEQEKGELNQQNSKLKLQNCELKQQNGKLKQENGKLEQENGELELQNTELEQQNGELKQQNGELKQEISKLKQ